MTAISVALKKKPDTPVEKVTRAGSGVGFITIRVSVFADGNEVRHAGKAIFLIDMPLGYLAWALFIATYVWPRLKAMDFVEAHRAIATFHSFRFFGFAFLLPGFVGPNLPQGFAMAVAYGDLVTALLATSRC